MELDQARVASARTLLRGQLVATPLIGDLRIPGFACEPSVRIKPESLQPSGSIWFRGAMHEIARQLGKTKGLLVAGDDRPLLAAARASALQRVPAVAFLRGDQNGLRALLPAVVEVEVVADAAQAQDAVEAARRQRGFRPMPGIEHPEYALGIATAGLELAEELPAETERILVSPEPLAAPVAAGLAAAGRPLPVTGIDPASASRDQLTDLGTALRRAARLDCDPDGLAALLAALARPDSCAILSC